MKKQTALTVALALALGVGAQAVASAAPYNDVPSSAKEAVDKLYKDGLLDNKSQKFGPSDKVSRVEMAKLVAEAMTKLEKADAQQKAMIKKLAAEFKPEMDAMKADVDGVKGDINTINGRLDGIEKNLGEKQNVKFDGYYRARFENQKDLTNGYWNRMRLNMTAPLDGNFVFKGRYEFNSKSNDTFDTTGTLVMTQAYVAGKVGDVDLVALGRMPLALGQGLLIDSAGKNDAAVIGFGKDLKVVVGAARVGGTVEGTATAVSATASFANLAATVAPNTVMSASYLRDADNAAYKSAAVGLKYTGFANFTVKGEYGENHSVLANTSNGDNAKAWYAQVKYLGANKAQVGTYGIWAGYKKADKMFDPLNLTTLEGLQSVGATNFNALNDLKGYEFGVEYTAFKNSVFTLKYLPLKQKSTNADQKQVIGQLEVFF